MAQNSAPAPADGSAIGAEARTELRSTNMPKPSACSMARPAIRNAFGSAAAWSACYCATTSIRHSATSISTTVSAARAAMSRRHFAAWCCTSHHFRNPKAADPKVRRQPERACPCLLDQPGDCKASAAPAPAAPSAAAAEPDDDALATNCLLYRRLRRYWRRCSQVVVLKLPFPGSYFVFAARKVASPLRPSSNLGDRFGPVSFRPAWLEFDAHPRCRARACSVRACWHVGSPAT